MRLQHIVIFILACISFGAFAQDMEQYTSPWEGKITNSNTFSLAIEIDGILSGNPMVTIANDNVILKKQFEKAENKSIRFNVGENLSFEGSFSEENNQINGFIKSGILLYHVKLNKTKADSFRGVWNILMVDELKSQRFYLSVENGSGNEYQAYPFFGDNRFTGTWCRNFQKKKDTIYFSDGKTGLNFKGKLLNEKIKLSIYLDEYIITEIVLYKSVTDWFIGNFKTNKNQKNNQVLRLDTMEKLIATDSLPNTHSVLVLKQGKTIYENYFGGYTNSIPHDTRSVSKSVSSAMVGIAKDKGLFANVNQSVFDFLPREYQVYRDTLKSNIDIKSLLTMSSGLDAIDFGVEGVSKGSEGNYQNSPDWTKTIMSAPMLYKPNTVANYGSANPHLLGIAIDSIVSESLAMFMDTNLFSKLGISNYIIQTDNVGNPYFGGGMYLTPRDMGKFGQLYLQQGRWEGEQIVSEDWVEDSFKNYRNLENTIDKNGYGYLWWHKDYLVNDRIVKSIEARGTGGQYIFVIPALEVVVVITSGNYRNGKFQQPEFIVENFILPSVLN